MTFEGPTPSSVFKPLTRIIVYFTVLYFTLPTSGRRSGVTQIFRRRGHHLTASGILQHTHVASNLRAMHARRSREGDLARHKLQASAICNTLSPLPLSARQATVERALLPRARASARIGTYRHYVAAQGSRAPAGGGAEESPLSLLANAPSHCCWWQPRFPAAARGARRRPCAALATRHPIGWRGERAGCPASIPRIWISIPKVSIVESHWIS